MDGPTRDALRLARALQEAVNGTALGAARDHPEARNWATLYDGVVLDAQLRGVSRKLFLDGHFAQAIAEGLKLVNNLVKTKANHPTSNAGEELDGAALMTRVFGHGAPLLRLNDLKSRSKRDVQTGYMRMLEGAMIGVRNPRAHELDQDDPQTALELLTLCNHFIRTINDAKRTRRRRRS